MNQLFPKYFADKDFSLSDIIQKKLQFKENAQKGILPNGCIGCASLEEKDWDKENYISIIYISHWTKCNCNCFYCYFDYNKKFFQKFKSKPLLPILKQMDKIGYLRNNDFVSITGGEIGELNEFDKILKFCLKKEFKNIVINSSCIKYKKSIEKGLKQDKVLFTVSLDCGDKYLYRKIKRIDAFDKVIKNLKKYIKAQGNNKYNVRAKYIILPSINDSATELIKWIDLCKNIGIKHIILDIETSFYLKNKNDMPKHIFDLILLAEQKACENNMQISYYSHAMQLKHDMTE